MSERAKPNVKSSVRLSFISTVTAGLFQLVTLTVLSRLLGPTDYGIYAMCWAIASLAPVLVNNAAERSAVVSHADGDDGDAMFVYALLALAASMLMLGLCWFLDRFAHMHIDLAILAVVCVASIVVSVAIPARVALRRELRFGPIALSEVTGLVIGQGIAAIGLARAGWGPYALAAGLATQNLTIVMVLWSVARPSRIAAPTLRRLTAAAKGITALGSNAALEIANAQVSPLVLGTRLGAVPLGLFNRAYSVVQIPIQLLINSMSRVMISALFSISGDRERLTASSGKLIRVGAILITPIAAGIAGASRNFVMCVFGSKWVGTVPIIPWLALSGWAMMMGALFGTICEAMRAFGIKARVQAISTTVLIVLSLGGTFWGLVGATTGIALSNCLFLVLYSVSASRLLGISLGQLAGWFVPGIVCALPCYAASALLGMAITKGPTVAFVSQISACGTCLGIAMLVFYPALTLEIADGIVPGLLARTGPLYRYLLNAREAQSA